MLIATQYLWPGSGGSCFSSLAMADSFGLGRGTSSASFAGVEAGFESRSSSRLLWLQTKIVFVQFIFRKRKHHIINIVFCRCRACRQQEGFEATASWRHTTIPKPNQGCVDFTPDCSRHTLAKKNKNRWKGTAWVCGCILVLKVTTLSFNSFVFYF